MPVLTSEDVAATQHVLPVTAEHTDGACLEGVQLDRGA